MRPLAGLDHLGAALAVVRRQLVDPDMDAVKRQIVRRQDQRVGRQGAAQFIERAQIAGERVALGLVRRHADIGRDPRQDLVAGDQHAGFGAIKAGQFRRMAFADDDAPFAPADHDRHAVTEPMIGRRHRRDAAAIARMAPGEKIAVGLVEPRPPRETARRLGIIRRPLAGHHAGVQPLLLGNP